jgi:hypothetical protein
MPHELVLKIVLAVTVVLFALTLAMRRRAGKPTRKDLIDLAGAGAGILGVVPSVLDLPILWSLPFFVAAFALIAVAFRRLPSPDRSPPPGK